ncbi:Glucoamylase like protein [Verticillium longisporum]|nr:Glucoamylase like protein [Verticillium longisporum]
MSFFHGLTLEAFPANLTSSLAQPFMSYLSSALLLGSVAVQHILGNIAATPPASDLESFIQRQYPIAYDGVLLFKSLVDIFVDKFDPALQDKIQQYVASSAQLQGVSNPSGELWNGEGLGEAKFNVDLTAFTGDWGRPQRDGPALRAIAIIGYAKWLPNTSLRTVSFFGCHRIRLRHLTLLPSPVHHDSQRSGLDANSILGSIHTFDPFAGCDAATFQPCSDRALASHKAIVDSFRSLYSINDGISPSSAVAIGRYPEDVYYGGQAWYLTTLAAAEQLYDAFLVWKLQGSITVTEVSLSFFQPHLPSITTGTYDNQTSAYASLTDAILAYADGFVKVVANFTPVDGTLDEQFDRNTGEPLSARDLTWSYASFLTAIRRRAGLESPGWINADATLIPATCSATSVFGVYATATATTFPSNLSDSKSVYPLG